MKSPIAYGIGFNDALGVVHPGCFHKVAHGGIGTLFYTVRAIRKVKHSARCYRCGQMIRDAKA